METYDNVIKVLNDFGVLLVERYKAKMLQPDERGYNAVCEGNLLNSVKYIVSENGALFELSLSLEDYWKYVEKGRKAGKFPPLSKIEEWIRKKPVFPRPGANGKIPTVKQLSFLIGRKIKNEGIKARPFIGQTIDELMGDFEVALNEALEKDALVIVDDLFKDF